MGATRRDVLRFLGWQFARPVLWANLLAVGIALATVAAHALLVARAKPVDALRYE